jgi:hypothetical protein
MVRTRSGTVMRSCRRICPTSTPRLSSSSKSIARQSTGAHFDQGGVIETGSQSFTGPVATLKSTACRRVLGHAIRLPVRYRVRRPTPGCCRYRMASSRPRPCPIREQVIFAEQSRSAFPCSWRLRRRAQIRAPTFDSSTTRSAWRASAPVGNDSPTIGPESLMAPTDVLRNAVSLAHHAQAVLQGAFILAKAANLVERITEVGPFIMQQACDGERFVIDC